MAVAPTRKLIFSARAETDLERLGDWIAADNEARAVTFITELRESCRLLLDFPQAGPPAPEFGVGIRKLTRGNYLILYRVGRNVTIVSVRHAALERAPLSHR